MFLVEETEPVHKRVEYRMNSKTEATQAQNTPVRGVGDLRDFLEVLSSNKGRRRSCRKQLVTSASEQDILPEEGWEQTQRFSEL